MKLTNKELEKLLLEKVKNVTTKPSQTNEERRNSKKSGVLSNSKIPEEDENTQTFAAKDTYRSEASYKWAAEQVEELKPFGNFYNTYLDDKPTREL